VVGDVDASEILSAEVFSNEVLMKFFLQREIRYRQQALMDALRHRMTETAKQKFEHIQVSVDKVNRLFQQTFVRHLMRDVASKGPLQIVDLFRDHHDVEAVKTGIPRASTVGRESNLTVFHVQKMTESNEDAQDSTLEFSWKYPFFGADSEKNYGKAFVTVYQNEIWYSSDGLTDWKKLPDWVPEDADLRRVHHFLESLQLTTTDEWLDDKKSAYEQTLQRLSLIRQSTSSADLLKTQQDYGFSGYPTHERFILPEHISVDVTD